LALDTSMSNPDDIHSEMYFEVKIVFLPSILDNQEYLQVFENGEHLEYFLVNENEDEDNEIAPVSKNCV